METVDHNGKKLDPKNIRYSVIHHYNSPNSCTLEGGRVVTRQKSIYIPEQGGSILCAPDDLHFIYDVPDTPEYKGYWSFMCTCGSPAVIVGSEAYKQYSSNGTLMLVCMMFLTTGKHQTSFIAHGGVK